jgi:WD repeat-containing protein 48
VDVEDCADVSEGECIVLCQDTGGRSMASSEGVNKIIAMDDNLLWSASSSSKIQRWRVPQRRSIRTGSLLLDGDAERSQTSNISTPNKSPPKAVNSSPSSSQDIHDSSVPSSQDGIATESWLHLQNREEMTSHGIPFQSLVKLTSPHDPYTTFSFQKGKDPEVATLYSAASVMSVPRAPAAMRSPQRAFISPHTSPLRSGRTEDTIHQVNTARTDYEEREIAADAIPLCGVPDYIIDGDHGLVRSIMLNDRIHALTVDTSGEVAVWDIVRAVCRGRFAPEEVASASQSGSIAGSGGGIERSPREALEVVRERIEGEAVVTPWSVVDTKTGVLTVHLNEKCFEGEVYADEVGIAHASDEARRRYPELHMRLPFFFAYRCGGNSEHWKMGIAKPVHQVHHRGAAFSSPTWHTQQWLIRRVPAGDAFRQTRLIHQASVIILRPLEGFRKVSRQLYCHLRSRNGSRYISVCSLFWSRFPFGHSHDSPSAQQGGVADGVDTYACRWRRIE